MRSIRKRRELRVVKREYDREQQRQNTVTRPTEPSGEGFFSQGRWKERVANRRKFRVAVSGNRKWIFIGIAVIAVCGTIVYLSVTYGGGLMGFLR